MPGFWPSIGEVETIETLNTISFFEVEKKIRFGLVTEERRSDESDDI